MITGAIVDELSDEFPATNWSRDEWAREIAVWRADGVDTLVVPCTAANGRALYDSRVLRRERGHLFVQEDLAALFLELAREHGLSVWLGGSDLVADAHELGPGRAVEIAHAAAAEAWERYGRHAAFRGWCAASGVASSDERALVALEDHVQRLRALSALPVLVAPRLAHAGEDRARLFAALAGIADVVLLEERADAPALLADRIAESHALARRHGAELWSHVACTAARPTPRRHAMRWPELRHAIESSRSARVSRIVTSGYAHGLSPHAFDPGAQALHRRYREWLATSL